MTTGPNKKKRERHPDHRREVEVSPAAPAFPPGFLARHGYGGEALRRRLNRIDWSHPDARRRGRSMIAIWADTVRVLLANTARDRRRKLSTFMSALLEREDPVERPWLWLALQHDADAYGSLSADTRHALEAAMRPLLTHAALLAGREVPAARLRDVADIDADTLLALGLRECSGVSRQPGKPIPLASLMPLAEGGGDDGARALLARLRLIRRTLADHPVTPLGHATFRKLSPALRRPLLFTPELNAFFLDAGAQAATRPPSPGFDPLFLDRAIDDLARGRLEHVDVDTLVLGAREHPTLLRRAVGAIVHGQGTLRVSDEVRERLIACATEPALCLAACAAARSVDDMRRALSQPRTLPPSGTLSRALHRVARIAWRDALPSEVPPLVLADPAFLRDQLQTQADALARFLSSEPGEMHLPPALLFRHFVAWLELVNRSAAARQRNSSALPPTSIADSLAARGGALATEIDGNDLHALHRAGPEGSRLALSLAGALRAHNPTRWEHGFFARLVDADPELALQVAGESPRAHEIEALLPTPAGEALFARYAAQADQRQQPGWREFVARVASWRLPPASWLVVLDRHPALRDGWQEAADPATRAAEPTG